MSLQDLQHAILTEAETLAQQIRERDQKLLAAAKNRIKHQAQQLEEKILTTAQALAETQAANIHQAARREAKAAVLLAKQSELEHLKTASIAAISSWDTAKILPLFTALFQEVPSKKGTIIAGEHHIELIRELAKKHHLPVAKDTVPHELGFIYRGASEEANFMISHVVEQIFQHHRAQIARRIFE